ncbi:MAG: hypothetical protein JST84_04680 [Acidobacteria bacterium]|nr:hypothetical protein [Acidobacteriota bacterium]
MTTSLINTNKIRSVIARLFTGSAVEILGELLQNSQRANASRVDIVTTEDGFTYYDNGDGIKGLAGFETLLTIADSAWEEDVNQNQNPMGLGIQSLLANKNVTQVSFHSGDLKITIDTARWWDDNSYVADWQKLVEAVASTVSGLRIEVIGTLDLKGAFKPPIFSKHPSPAAGYENFLQVFMDGEQVDTKAPTSFTSHILQTEFSGCKLLINIEPTEYLRTTTQTVNWYGQLISKEVTGTFGFYLEVNCGQPVTPMAPSRRGIVQDSKWAALQQFVQAKLKEFFQSPEATKAAPAIWLSYLKLLSQHERQEMPYTVVREWEPEEHYTNDYNYDVVSSLKLVPNLPTNLYLDPDIIVEGVEGAAENWDTFSDGISSFVPVLQKAGLSPYLSTLMPTQSLHWRPGSTKQTLTYQTYLVEGGEWGLSDNADNVPTNWMPVGKSPVFTVSCKNNWDCTEPLFYAANITPQEFYKEYAEAGFDPNNDDFNTDHMHEKYCETIEDQTLRISGKLRRNFSRNDLRQFTPTGLTLKTIAFLADNQLELTFDNQEKVLIPHE